MTPYDNRYFVVLARGIDLLAATVVTRDYGITLSSWCGLELRKGAGAHRWAKIMGAFLNWFEDNHCELAIIADLARARYVIATLE